MALCLPRSAAGAIEGQTTSLHSRAASATRTKGQGVIGSSLMVYSGHRFCEWAYKMGKPIAAIKLGQTRADHLLSLKFERSSADALRSLIERLGIN
jgi:NAD-dependent SIR2 family protein deacetylase